jgi:FKBP-type peptidyl-prolyl cis-trans isomerase FklB
MRRILMFVVAAAVAAPVIAQEEPAAKPAAKKPAAKASGSGNLKSLQDKASYAIGNNIGAGLRKQGVDLNLQLFIDGVKEGLAGTEAKLTQEEMQTVFEQFQKQIVDAQTQKNDEAGKVFLAANKKKTGVKVTQTGLQYKVLKAGNGPKPKKTDIIRAHYKGTLTDGTEFDSSFRHAKPGQAAQPAMFAVNQVIPGWVEALQQMPVGSKWQLVVPPDLAYGEEGFPPDIGPNATLVFEIELIGIEKPQLRSPKAPSAKSIDELPSADEK